MIMREKACLRGRGGGGNSGKSLEVEQEVVRLWCTAEAPALVESEGTKEEYRVNNSGLVLAGAVDEKVPRYVRMVWEYAEGRKRVMGEPLG